MQAQGVYFALIEQQNSYLAEDQEETEFENNRTNKIFFSNPKDSNLKRTRRPTIISLTPSILDPLFTNRSSIDTENSDEHIEKIKVIKNKICKNKIYSNRKKGQILVGRY